MDCETEKTVIRIHDLLEIAVDYCMHNLNEDKICPLCTLLEQIKNESEKIVNEI